MRVPRSLGASVLTALVVVVASVLFVSQARAEVRSYTLDVGGLSCLFRAYGLERALSSIEGVASVAVDATSGRVEVAVTEGAQVLPDTIEASVRGAGLVVERMRAVAAGTARGDRLYLGGNRHLTLRRGAGSETVSQMISAGNRAVVIGGLLARDGDGWTIEIASAQAQEPPPAPPRPRGRPR